MPHTYTCYLHRPGVMTPDLRVLDCDVDDVPRLILAQMHLWGRFDQIDVYDETEQQIYSFTTDRRAPN
jgi:hypothetical protein